MIVGTDIGYEGIGLFLLIGFFSGFFICYYRFNKLIECHNKIEAEKQNSIPQPVSNDPMIFQFHLLENSNYELQAYGIEGRHLTKKNHKKFMEILKFLYENERLRPFPPEHDFKLLKFEKKD
jgi:hypothetical protein